MTPVLEVHELSKSFGGVHAVDAVSLSIIPGELLALIGPNGAGKTTCFNLIAGQLTPDTGTVRFAGTNIEGKQPRDIWRLGVGRTFQIASTFGSMTVCENVQMAFLSLRRRTWNTARLVSSSYRSESLALLDRLGVADQADRTCALLAYGDVKRVELAIALVNEPRLLLMDEPTAGMAPGEREELMKLTSELVTERQIGVLFTEHDMDAVFGYSHRIMVLDRGRVVSQGKPNDVRADPEVRRIYLGDDASLGQ
jgi:branched-chain amino acid transport system ATP-binding protein